MLNATWEKYYFLWASKKTGLKSSKFLRTTRELVEKYVSGQCTPEERADVEAYLKRTQDATLFDEVLRQQWEQMAEQPSENVDVAGSLYRFKEKRQRLQSAEPPANKHPSKSFGHSATFRVATSLMLLITVGIGWWYTQTGLSIEKLFATQVTYQEFVNTTGQQAQITLTDGSRIWLNVDSRVKYPEKFTGNERNVYLTGEALFEVTKDPGKPFRVHTQHLMTTVLGTSFQVRAYHDDKLAQVTVVTGKVAVQAMDSSGQTGKHYLLHPRQQVVLNKETRQMQQDSTDLTEAAALKNGELYLRDLSLGEIARRLERWYGVQISFEQEALQACAFSATFKRCPLRNVLDRLQLTAGFRYEINGKLVKIKGNTCE